MSLKKAILAARYRQDAVVSGAGFSLGLFQYFSQLFFAGDPVDMHFFFGRSARVANPHVVKLHSLQGLRDATPGAVIDTADRFLRRIIHIHGLLLPNNKWFYLRSACRCVISR